MIVHVVLFVPRPDLTPAERRQIGHDLLRAATTIPSIVRCRIGRRVRHGHPGYEQMMTDSYSHAAVLEFADRAGLVAYLQHPAHQTIGLHFATATRRSLAYDCEMTDAADADAELLAAE